MWRDGGVPVLDILCRFRLIYCLNLVNIHGDLLSCRFTTVFIDGLG